MAMVKGHRSLRKSCGTCGIPHSKGQHSFHGKGSFAKTHYSFDETMNMVLSNPKAKIKKPRRKKK